jgi:hypothetical protein
VKTDEVMELWVHYFPDVELQETRWFERCSSEQFAEAVQIAKVEDLNGRFVDRSGENIPRYVTGILRKLDKLGVPTETTSRTVKATFELTIRDVAEADWQRFENKLTPFAEQCSVFNNQPDKYGRFWFAGTMIYAHYFSFWASNYGGIPTDTFTGVDVAHSCGHPGCCNDEHLRLTSHAVNLRERG